MSFVRIVCRYLSITAVFFLSSVVIASEIKIQLNVPRLDVDPYHKPYIAIWLETPDREAIGTIALWVEKDTWFKDLRQWWRKIGRTAGGSLDGVTGATRLPGRYSIVWVATDQKGEALPAGEYLINFEASREEGGRSYVRKKITLGEHNSIHVAGSNELGEISITTE